MPTTTGEAYKIGSKSADPVDTYKEDVFTVTSNVVGIPTISIPFGKGSSNLPLGIQLMGKKFNEAGLFKLAKFVESKKGE